MINLGSGNCFYNGTMRFFNIQGIHLEEFELMHLFGGYSLFLKKFENDIIPTYGIYGSLIREHKFKEYTGVNCEVFFELDEKQAFERTDAILSNNEQQLVFANCFYLPFDQKNYQKNIDNHLLIIHSYDKKTNSYTVSDDKGTNIMTKEQLSLARKSTTDGEFKTIHFTDTGNLNKLNIQTKLNSVISKQAKFFLENNLGEIKRLEEIIIEINGLESIYKKLGLKSLYKTIIHPNGPVITRNLMALSFENEIYRDKFMKLSSQWQGLANNLIRLSSDSVPLEHVLDKVNKIYLNERKFNENITFVNDF